MTTDPRSEAIKAMGEVIAAQALHIEKLEAGHWSKHTRKRVDRAKRKLDEVTGPTANDQHLQESITQHRGRIPEQCEARVWDDRCTLPAGHSQNHHFPDFEPRAEGPQPHTHMFDKGGELPTGLVEVTNDTGADRPFNELRDLPHTPILPRDERRCHGVRTNDGQRCILLSDHLWPHRFDTE